MQTIYLDTATSSVVPVIYAKQNDVGRKFEIYLTESGIRKEIPRGCLFSAWYDGASGEGNYSHIGERSAFAVSYNTIVVEMITQMLQVPGDGEMCIVMSGEDGTQIATWNIPYCCEDIPGANSAEAEDYYSAFTEAAQKAEDAAVRAEAAANSIVTTPRSVVGVEVTLNGAEDNSVFHGLKLYGKSTQDGTPSLENPVDVVNAGADGSIVVNVNDTQTLIALTPNGLPGIKVSSGGNHTDSNDQQWICDEMDFAAGVYRKWVDSYTFTGTETNLSYYSGGADVLPTLPLPNAAPEYGNCMSNMLNGATSYSNLMGYGNTVTTTSNAIVFHIAGYKGVGTTYPAHNDLKLAVLAKLKELADNGTPLTVYYQLVTPIETPLSAEELEQYAALRTSSPTTTVSNDENVAMEVSYYPPNAALPSSGGTVGGGINMAGNRITGLGVPIGDSDAVNKDYADSTYSYKSPEMKFGIEYLTEEYWNGERVYAKLIDFGALPVSAYKNCNVSPDGGIRIIWFEGIATASDASTDSDLMYPIPSGFTNGTVRAHTVDNNLQVVTESDFSNYNAYFNVKYIKP